MGAALETSAPPGAKPSFKTRLKAWWEGYDPADLMAEALPVEPVLVTATPAEAPPAEVPPLEQPHIKVAQQIWGEGFMRPGGAAAILTLVKPFAINPSMTVMEFGGSAEDIARTCHVHPTLSEAVKEAALGVHRRTIHL